MQRWQQGDRRETKRPRYRKNMKRLPRAFYETPCSFVRLLQAVNTVVQNNKVQFKTYCFVIILILTGYFYFQWQNGRARGGV